MKHRFEISRYGVRPTALLVLCLGLAACAGAGDRYGDAASGYVGDAAALVAAADWTRAEQVTLSLGEYEYEPEALVIRSGQPYSLTLMNEGEAAHTFTSPGFFRAVAVRALISAQGVERSPLLESVSLAAGERKTLEFIGARPGTYRLECERPFHAVFGMTGTLTIE